MSDDQAVLAEDPVPAVEVAGIPDPLATLIATQNKRLDAIATLLATIADRQNTACHCMARVAAALEIVPPTPPRQAVGPGGKR